MNFRTILLAGVCLGAGAGSAMAQDGQASTSQPAGEVSSIDDIIVTAQRRDESQSRTPVAVAVISAETLARAQVTSEQDLRVATPGLSVRSSVSSNQLNYSLRGQSQDAFSGTRPGVLPYINEVQIGGSGGSTAFYDLQSVQVLKGPQGTLFGRSATGGAVLFTTTKPSDDFGGYASFTGGNYDAFKAEGAISGPIVADRLNGRLAGFYQSRDGYQYNLYDGGREGDIDRWGVRGSLSADFGNVTNDLVIDYFQSRSENTISVISGLLPFTGGGAGNPPYIPISFLYSGTSTPIGRATGIGTVIAFTGAPGAAATAFYDAYFSDPRRPATGIAGVLADQQARGPYIVNSDGENVYDADNIIVTNATTVDLDDNTRLRGILGLTRIDTLAAYDADGTPYNISSQGPRGSTGRFDYKTRQFSGELQLQGSALTDRLEYVTGLYYSDEDTTALQESRFFDLLFGGQTQHNDYIITNRTYAGYAQGTYSLNESGLAVTAGIRYTSEKVGKEVLPTDSIRLALGTPPPPGFSYDQSETYNRVSWQLGIQNQVTPDLLLYAVSRRAYKSGGYNGTVAPAVGSAATAGDGYGAEQVTDIEAGLKFQGQLGSVPARFSMAAFNNWIEDSQRTAYTLVLGNPASLTVNVPEGRTYGLELEGLIRPTDWLAVGGTFNYTHARYTDGAVIANGSAQAFDQVPDTPEYSGTFFADITVPLSGPLTLVAHADVYAQDDSYTTPRSQNANGTTIPAYTLANFRIGLNNTDANWSLTANLKNAFDEVYYGGGIPTGEIYQINTLVPGDPRTFTVEARMAF